MDFYNSQHGGPASLRCRTTRQYKCYDGMHNWNQLQPAPYDGMYSFPSVTGIESDDRKADRDELHGLRTELPTRRDHLSDSASPCCPPASTWSKWSFPRATNW